ncbi:MAG: tetratricopeptide repeat protein [Flavobacteriales bacterium]|nr:tetratricopeptide repeat protein [Flavobacteriales bacterium]
MKFANLILLQIMLLAAASGAAQKPEGYYLNAVNSVNAREFDQALGELNKAIELDPAHAQSLILRAYLYLKAGDKKQALRDYSSALKAHPTDLGALTNRALLYMEMEEYEKAEKDLRQRLKGDPHNWMASYDLAYCYGLMEKYDQAIEGFSEVIKRKPDYAEAYLNRGFAPRLRSVQAARCETLGSRRQSSNALFHEEPLRSDL